MEVIVRMGFRNSGSRHQVDSSWSVFAVRTRLSLVDLRTDSAAADRGESAVDFGPTGLVFARARETPIGRIEKGRAAKRCR
jgi:hypothetical protein